MAIKKILILITFASLLSVPEAIGQIQRKFFGLELGVSTKEEVTNIIKQKGLELYNVEENGFSAIGTVRFGGIEWKSIKAEFLNDKLLSINFLILPLIA